MKQYLEYMSIMEIYMDMRLDTALTLNPPNVNTELMRRSFLTKDRVYGWHSICISRAPTLEMSLRKEEHRHAFYNIRMIVPLLP